MRIKREKFCTVRSWRDSQLINWDQPKQFFYQGVGDQLNLSGVKNLILLEFLKSILKKTDPLVEKTLDFE